MDRRRARHLLAMAASAVLVFPAAAVVAHADDTSETTEPLPIVFVHGGAGSAAQYQTQEMRFASNGYPAERISGFEYNSASIAAILLAPAGLDAHIDAVLDEHDTEQVHLVGHSLGTSVSSSYLSQPARAAKVASYVGIDGQQGATCPGGVPCLGIFANSTGNLGGNNLHLPDQTHVEVATSAESFAGQYEFFTGEPPATTLVLPVPPGQVELSGRVVNFPANSGAAGTTVTIYEVNARTGARSDDEPVASFAIGPDGSWGPVKLNGQRNHEFEAQRADGVVTHLYYQPFIRSSDMVRLLLSPPDSAILANTNTGDGHAAAVVIRNREWWSTRGAGTGGNDQLWVSGPGQEPLQVLSAGTGNGSIGIHIHDAAATPGVSTGNLLPFFPSQAFQTGVDVYLPAADPPDGTVTFANAPRGDTDRMQVVNVPNWPSSTDRISVTFTDYVQDITTWGECLRVKPSPCR